MVATNCFLDLPHPLFFFLPTLPRHPPTPTPHTHLFFLSRFPFFCPPLSRIFNWLLNVFDIAQLKMVSMRSKSHNRPLSLKSSRMRNERTRYSGSRRERLSWVAGRAHSCISLVLVVVKTSHFTATRWAEEITAV